ncbi:DEAD/DEAH box helicase [Nannocystis bainbridge]|uniref:DEAD/DEAH box helicase n=1 Tax=Nannocystis bainbridge TaxID=2995303 RepID=A0ABT5DW69_9BACT|nr:DEAD/DEAH box helicase [Nannocystis bainbridge]MDC0717884.1 DEAD/DEAH box helicase [Nannocystis bainbridge]
MFTEVLEPVHRAAAPAAWHRGLKLARLGAARVQACDASGWVFAIARLAGSGVRAEVRWAWDGWRCDCGAGPAVCEHVVAAALVLHTAGGLLEQIGPQVAAALQLGYRLQSAGDKLQLRVVAVSAGGEAVQVGAVEADDPLLAAMPAGAKELMIYPDIAEFVVARLVPAFDVTLDGAPVAIEAAPLRVRTAAAIEGRTFVGGRLALVGQVLRFVERIAVSEETSQSPEAGSPAESPEAREPEKRTLEPQWTEPAAGAEAGEPEVTFKAPSGASSSGETQVDAARVVQAWRSGQYALQADDGGLVWLPRDWLERYGPMLEQFVAARRADGKRPRWARTAAAGLCEALQVPPPPELAGLAALSREEMFATLPAATLPADLTAQLRDYQRRGVDWLSVLRDAGIGALLADDMGLGKTLQTLTSVRGRTLVVAPTSTLHNWLAECRRFRPGLRAALYHGPKRNLEPTADVTITSYAVLRLDREKLSRETWDTVVLDEAHAIKEPTTATASAAFGLRAGWRVALSGTPVQNRLTELWSLSHFLNPGLLGQLREFVAGYGKAVEQGRAARTAELQAKLRPFMLRRRKQEVAPELPPLTEIVLRCPLDAEERRIYDGLRVAAELELPKLQSGGGMLEALELLLRLRQAACHTALVPGQEATRSSKVELLLAQLTEVTAAGHRALVFSQWTSLLDLVEDALTAAELEHVRLDGATEDRAGVVARFQAEDGPPVMLISLKAGGTGLNLTAADYVYLLDPWWNPSIEDQAGARAHRIGQSRPVFLHRLIAEDTVEEKILELHARKRALAQATVDEGDVSGLGREELLELLR